MLLAANSKYVIIVYVKTMQLWQKQLACLGFLLSYIIFLQFFLYLKISRLHN